MSQFFTGDFLDATIGQWEYIVRILIAVICGGAIGFERSHRNKEAGIRTHIIVSLGSALLMIVSKYGFFDVIIYDSISLDASRIAANIITGISFLGAGVIFLKGGSIKGLTTAAGLWTTAGIGVALGAGMYTVGIVSTVLVVAIQYFLHRYNIASETTSSNEITLLFREKETTADEIMKQFEKRTILVQEFRIIKNEDGTTKMVIIAKSAENTSIPAIVELLRALPEVIEISVTT